MSLVNVVGERLEQQAQSPLVLVARRPDEAVKRDLELLPDVTEDAFHLVAIRVRVHALLARRALHVETVLVVAHLEVDVITQKPVEAREDVG